MIDFNRALEMVRRLGQMDKWPYSVEAHNELARVLAQNARDVEHADETLVDISENWDRCPTARELKLELLGPMPSIPDTPKTCKLGQCDGSGWEEVYYLHTMISIPGGAAYKEKKQLTRAEYNDLVSKVDFDTQTVYTGVRHCGCRV